MKYEIAVAGKKYRNAFSFKLIFCFKTNMQSLSFIRSLLLHLGIKRKHDIPSKI